MSAEGPVFLDTNILVYQFDASAPAKRKRAIGLVRSGLESGGVFISSQVVQEFLNLATKKFAPKLSTADAAAVLDTMLLPLCRVFPSPQLFRKALEIQGRYGLSWYDGLIVAAALEGGASVLHSEDMQHGQKIEGMRIVNPFAG